MLVLLLVLSAGPFVVASVVVIVGSELAVEMATLALDVELTAV